MVMKRTFILIASTFLSASLGAASDGSVAPPDGFTNGFENILPAVSINAFSVLPTVILPGGSATVSWNVSNAVLCTASGGGGTWGGSVDPVTGIQIVTIDSAGNYNLGLSCSNATSNDQASLAVTVTSADSDGDRLADAVETNTGVYVDLNNTGTNPFNADTDGDGIRDGDEVLGTLQGLDLPAMGVNPLQKDLLLEYDWFDDSVDCSPHSHRPTAAIIARASAAFTNSPTQNPGSATGVNLISDYGQGGVFTGGNLISDANGVIDNGISGTEYRNYKAANFASNRNGYFHYVFMPHRYNTDSTSSGQAELPGDDLIVSLYCVSSERVYANTILHEAGHNLSLRHGGNDNCNHKPNYNSVMSYKYQFPGVDNNCTPPANGVTDFSIGDRIDLDENNLDENNGTCGPGFPYDWNGNNTIESSVVTNTNSYGDEEAQCGDTLTTLRDYDDWGNLFFGGLPSSAGARLTPPEIITEQPVPDEYLEITTETQSQQ